MFWQSTNTAKKNFFLNGLQIYYGEINLVTINGKVEIELSPFGPWRLCNYYMIYLTLFCNRKALLKIREQVSNEERNTVLWLRQMEHIHDTLFIPKYA